MFVRFALLAVSLSLFATGAQAAAVVDVTDKTFKELVLKPANNKVR